MKLNSGDGGGRPVPVGEVLDRPANQGLVALFALIIVLEAVKIVQTLFRVYRNEIMQRSFSAITLAADLTGAIIREVF